MNGQWFFRSEQGVWALISYNHVEMTISAEMLQVICERTGMEPKEALAWIATRPQAPYRRAA